MENVNCQVCLPSADLIVPESIIEFFCLILIHRASLVSATKSNALEPMDVDWSPLACNIFFSHESPLQHVWKAKARKMKFRFRSKKFIILEQDKWRKKMHYYSASTFIRDRVPLSILNFGAMGSIER